MDFGMPTLTELETLPATVMFCKAHGLKFIELNMNMPQYQPDKLDAAELLAYQKAGIYFTIHLDENFNAWDFNPLVSQAYVETILRSIALALAADMPVINMHMHSGVVFTLPKEKIFLFDRYFEEYMEKTRRLRQLCEQAIGGHGLKICIENCGGFTGFQRQAIAFLLESPVFGLTLDIGHSHSAKEQDMPLILAHADKLFHMHVHDAAGNSNHLALGTGEIDIKEKLKLAKRHRCRCVLETKTTEGLSASVANLFGRGFSPSA